MQLKDVLTKTTLFFKSKGIESARLDTELLLASALGWQRMKLYLNYEYDLTEDELNRSRELVRRRASGEPVAYILGRKDFYNHSFLVDANVLIPRPDTETLVEDTLAWLRTNSVRVERRAPVEESAEPKKASRKVAAKPLDEDEAEEARKHAELLPTAALEADLDRSYNHKLSGGPASVAAKIVDLGTGSGCIGLSLIKELPDAQLLAVDLSAGALGVAMKNAEELAVADRTTFMKKDAGSVTSQDVISALGGLADTVVANPPYIAPDDPQVEENVKKFEPSTALFSEEGGLKHVREWAHASAALVRDGGRVMFEIGYEQGRAVVQAFEAVGCFDEIKMTKDLSGHDRFVSGVKRLS